VTLADIEAAWPVGTRVAVQGFPGTVAQQDPATAPRKDDRAGLASVQLGQDGTSYVCVRLDAARSPRWYLTDSVAKEEQPDDCAS
jgi:hypothetical protein